MYKADKVFLQRFSLSFIRKAYADFLFLFFVETFRNLNLKVFSHPNRSMKGRSSIETHIRLSLKMQKNKKSFYFPAICETLYNNILTEKLRKKILTKNLKIYPVRYVVFHIIGIKSVQ